MEAVRLQRRQGQREFRPPPPLRQAVLPSHHGLGCPIRRCSWPARFRSSPAYHRRFAWLCILGQRQGRRPAAGPPAAPAPSAPMAGGERSPSWFTPGEARLVVSFLEVSFQIFHLIQAPFHAFPKGFFFLFPLFHQAL